MSEIITKKVNGVNYKYVMTDDGKPQEIYIINNDGTEEFVCSYEYYGDIIKRYVKSDGYESNRDIVDNKVIRDYDNRGNLIEYKYDNNGNILEKKITRTETNIEQYEYDDLNRVIKITSDTTGYWKKTEYYDDTETPKYTIDSFGIEYGFDRNKNVIAHSDPNSGLSYKMTYYEGTNIVKSYTDNANNTIYYDKEGNIIDMEELNKND